MELGKHFQDLTYLEFFSGEGNVFRCIRADHHPSCAVDIRYMPDMPNSPMNILTDAGLLSLNAIWWKTFYEGNFK